MIVPDLIKAVEAGQEKARLEIRRKHCMNKRIVEFAELSGFKVNWQHEDVQALKMARFEKFVELIVQECTTILANNSEFRGCVIIEEHFGVEPC